MRTRRDLLKLSVAAGLAASVPVASEARPPRRGGVLKQVGPEPWSLDIQATAAPPTLLLSSLVRRPLFKLVPGPRHAPSDLTLAPDLALKAEASTDGRRYAITLRRGARWEDRLPLSGREVTAADVKYTIERAVKRSPYAALLGPVQGVEVSDPRTLRVHLAEPHAPFLQMLAEPWLAILAPEVEDRFGDLQSHKALIGCGPFTLSRYEAGVKAVFTRNPGYYQTGLPYVDRLEWLFIRERTTQLSLFRAGQVDIPSHDSRVPRAEVAALRQLHPAYPVVHWDGLPVRGLAMRTDRPPFSDVRVRRALSLAVDRKRWVAEYFDGQGIEDHGPVPAPLREWKLSARDLGEGARYLDHDPALAAKLLAEAGFPGGLKIRCFNAQGQGAESIEEVDHLAASLRTIGVELTTAGEEPGTYVRGSFVSRFEETSWGVSPLFTEVDGYLYTLFRSGQPGNKSQVADRELDVMLEAQRHALSRPARKKIIDDIQRHLADRVYYVFTPAPRTVHSWAPRVRGYSPRNSLDRGAQLEAVWLDR
jgi:peptide/nickel transport system substrate-binding protein